MPRVLTLQDVIGQISGEAQEYIDPNPDEMLNQFALVGETLKIQPTLWTLNNWTPYPWLVANADGPTGLWLLGDPVAPANAFDSMPYLTGGKNPAAINGTVTFGVAGVFVGLNAATFDGTTGYLSSAWQSAPGNAWALEAWINSSSGTTQQTAVGTSAVNLGLNASGQAFLTDGTHTIVGSTALNGAWHYLAATWDGTTARLYVDGSQVGTSTTVTGNTTATAMTIGRDQGASSHFWNGKLAAVGIYPNTLSAAAIANHNTWGTAAKENGAYTYNFGSPTKRGWFPYPLPPQRGSNRWNSAIWNNASFTWG